MLSPVSFFDTLRIHPQVFVPVELLENPSLTSNKVNALSPVINARRLYQSCMNESLIEERGAASLLALINGKFGGWPILRSSNWDEKSFDFAELLLRINDYATSIIFAIDTSINDRNSSIHSIRVRSIFLPPIVKNTARWYPTKYHPHARLIEADHKSNSKTRIKRIFLHFILFNFVFCRSTSRFLSRCVILRSSLLN